MTSEPFSERDENPFRVLPSATADDLATPGDDGTALARRVGAWVIVFLLNLPIAVMNGRDAIPGPAGA